MNGSLVEGPGRHLHALHGRLMVDLAKGTDDDRHCRAHLQHQKVREQLQKSLAAAEPPAATPDILALNMLATLSRQRPPGHLALSLTAQTLALRRQRCVKKARRRLSPRRWTGLSGSISTALRGWNRSYDSRISRPRRSAISGMS